MFTEQRVVFYHCVSPVHLGSGTALGVVDNPIQRERHSDFPVFAGSGIKGALRHHAQDQALLDHAQLNAIFGPESGAGAELHAGAVSFTDAQLLCFPVRSAKQGFAYITCPLALATAKRMLLLAGLACDWAIPQGKEDHAARASDSLGKERIALELFAFASASAPDPAALKIAADLADRMPAGPEWEFFRQKLAADLLILCDTDFTYFVRNATSVEPHVSINDQTGAASDGLLFYTENLPPESILVGLMLASKTRVRVKDGAPKPIEMTAAEVASAAQQAAAGLLQIGGDATTGRGQIVASFAAQGAHA